MVLAEEEITFVGEYTMKIKTNKSNVKRFKATGTGKLRNKLKTYLNENNKEYKRNLRKSSNDGSDKHQNMKKIYHTSRFVKEDIGNGKVKGGLGAEKT